MNRERAKELLPIIEHFANGGTVQMLLDSGSWVDDETPMFHLEVEYRIKPEPREFWICPEEREIVTFNPIETRLERDNYAGWNWIKVREVLE